MTGEGKLLIGTSGWSHRSWRGPFFPGDSRPGSTLSIMPGSFDHRAQRRVLSDADHRAVRGWAEHTPDDFVFAWKASKFITHWKRLKDTSRNSLDLMETGCGARRQGRTRAVSVAAAFREEPRPAGGVPQAAPRKRDYAFEFRHPSWYEDDIIDLLRDNGIALCISDHHDAPSPWLATADHIYVRGHGPQAAIAATTAQTLAEWSRLPQRQRRNGRHVFVYFDNDQKSAAPKDASPAD